MDSTEGKSFGAAFYYLLFLNQTNSIISQGAEKNPDMQPLYR